MSVAAWSAAIALTLWQPSASALVIRRPEPQAGPVLGADGKPVPPAPPPPIIGGDRDPGALMDHAAESGAQVYVDDSFASVEKLRTAIRYANQGQSQLAINNFQDIITNYGQKLVFLNDGSYCSITDYVREKLLQMNAVKEGMYDQLYGGQAKQAIDAAVAKHDLAGLILACDRYFPSSAALSGLSQAAEWYFERAEFEAAARIWMELLDHPLAGKMIPELLFRAASAESLAQNSTAAKMLRTRLEKEYPDASATVSGQEVKLLAKLDEVMAMPAWEPADVGKDEWPEFGGGPGRSRLLDSNASIGARLWSYSTGEDVPNDTAGNEQLRQQQAIQVQLARRRGIATATDPDAGTGLSSFAVLSNGALLINNGDRVVALSATAGTQLWQYPKNSVNNSANAAANQALMVARYGAAIRPTQHDSAAVYGDFVYAMLPVANGSNPIMLNDEYNGGMMVAPNRLVCLKRDSGEEAWTRNAADIKVAGTGAMMFVGSPTVTRQGVFIMARRMGDPSFTQQYLVRLDSKTGEPTWSCYLCSTSSNMPYTGYPVGMMGSIAVPTIVDDVVYISTGQGADCAVDANVGRILWLRTVDAPKTGPSDMPDISLMSASWKFNPPMITGDKMIACDSGSSLRIYNRWNGKLLSNVKASDLDMSRIDVVAGMIGSHLILSGNNNGTSRMLSVDVAELAKRDGKGAAVPGATVGPLTLDWHVEVTDAGRALGRTFLTSNAFYVPFEKELIHIDPVRGTREAWEWPRTEKDTPSRPGNLLVTSEQVVVVNDFEIAGYSKWETALNNALEKIKAHPTDPSPYLALAEISFRTNHHDLAQENMQKSVELANLAENNQGGAVQIPGFLKRLYQTNLNFAEQLLAKPDNDLRDMSRFYYEQCKLSAREPEQHAEWRMRLAELSIKQKKTEEAATLYSEVLFDPALRAAGYREQDNLASAGATAELRLRNLIKDDPQVYTRFEDQAAALLGKSRADKDIPGLQQVVDAYPNSKASLEAGTDLAAAYRGKQDWANARRVLWWLEPRVTGDAQARAIADLVEVCMGLKKYHTAVAWTNRGLGQFKEMSFTSSEGSPITFADVRKKVASAGVPDVDGRVPAWHLNMVPREDDPGTMVIGAPVMDLTPLAEGNLLTGHLLSPLEPTLSLHQNNLLFVQKNNNTLSIYDIAKPGRPAAEDISLLPPAAQSAPAILLGATSGHAVLMQPNRADFIDLKTLQLTSVQLSQMQAVAPRTVNGRINIGGQLVVPGNVVVIDGNQMIVQPDGSLVDPSGRPVVQGAGDPDSARRAAIAALPNAQFTNARIFSNRLIVLAGNNIRAFDITTGQPAWHRADGAELMINLPPGLPAGLVGNEDMIVVQQDSPDGASSTLFAIDADTGTLHKQIKIDGDHVNWRGLGDDGRLFVVTDQVVACYDLVSDQVKNLWSQPIQSRFAAATALTLDGLIVVDNNMSAICLSPENGEQRYNKHLAIPTPQGALPILRSCVDGDMVVYQGSNASHAILSQTGSTVWTGSYNTNTPPLQGLQPSDSYMMELASGSQTGAGISRAVFIIFRDPKGGKLQGYQSIISASDQREGPALKGWLVLDAGIALESPDGVHFWRNKEK